MAEGNAVTLGMVADGSTDNTPLMQQALDACVSQGLTGLYIPAGTYNFVLKGTPVKMPASFTVHGDSKTSTILKVDPVSWNYAGTGKTFSMLLYNDACTVTDLGFDGQKDSVNNGNFTIYGLNFMTRTNQTDSNCTFRDIVFSNQLSGNLALECFCISTGYYSQNLSFLRITCQDGNGTGISINGNMLTEIASPGTGFPSNCRVTDCVSTNMKWQGFTCYGARNIAVNNFYARSCGAAAVYGGQGINLEWTQNVTITGGSIENCYGAGIGGFGWHDNVQINGVLLQNNNQGDFPQYAEIGFDRGSWFTTSFAAGQRVNILGVLQSATIHNCTITPKTSGNYNAHLHFACDYAVTYPNRTASQPVNVTVSGISGSTLGNYRSTGGAASPTVYANDYQTSKGTWMRSYTYAVNDVRRNGGFVFTCTVAGTSSSGLGPVAGQVNDVVTDGTVTWKATAVATDVINVGTAWCKSTSYVVEDIRVNHGYAYRVVAPASGTATSGSGSGPSETTVGATQADGGVTWYCEGRVIQNTPYVPRSQDVWQPGVSFNNIESSGSSISTPVNNWTATGATLSAYSGSDATSSSAVTVTANGPSSVQTVSQSIKDPRTLAASASHSPYVAVVRYKNLSPENGWNFSARCSGLYSATYGTYQFDIQLGSPILDTGWKLAHIAFLVPSNSSAVPMIFYSGPFSSSSIVIDYVSIVPVSSSATARLRTNDKRSEANDVHFYAGDLALSEHGMENDLVCIESGSLLPLQQELVLTLGADRMSGTLQSPQHALVPGTFVQVAGGRTSPVVRRVHFVDRERIELDEPLASQAETARLQIQTPRFAALDAPEASPFVHVIGDKELAGNGTGSQLRHGWNVVRSSSTVRLPAAERGMQVAVANQTGQSIRVHADESESSALSLHAGDRVLFFCEQSGRWSTI